MKQVLIICIMSMICFSCKEKKGFTVQESELISQNDSLMRVLTIADHEDSLLLRTPCTDLSEKSFRSEDFIRLCSRMIRTVTDPSQDGVGIAGPQVGLSRRIVAVQRFDKEGEPFEVYGNIRITGSNGKKSKGPEGCLSVPDRRGDVLRWQDIEIEYDAVYTEGKVRTGSFKESISGFTAVIFQHETDHLDGVLYIDRL